MPRFISSGKKYFEKGDRKRGQTLYEEKGGQTLLYKLGTDLEEKEGQTLYENIKNGYNLVFFEKKLFYLIIAFYFFFTFNTQNSNIRAI